MTTRALPWTPPPAVDVAPLPVGKRWDAVRVEAPVGDRALAMLGDASGAVIQDTYGTLYWLIAKGTARGDWRLRQVRVLTERAAESTVLGVPPITWTDSTAKARTYWRVPLAPGQYLTNAERLWEVLAAADHAEFGARVEGRQFCRYCQLPTDEPVIIADEHGGSLGGGIIYACPRHARGYPVVEAEKLIDVLRRGREQAGA
ncbi:hypothetical protein [Streptomyces coffeae]|uniref:Uncharacterized protein n=1 Tax=Streptomyces coffeae TaxID=621382 RepID=A0ABS1NF09_9ACTN|nr:hypothetical protein [Streptomyces coffeae]MBL1098411.1 hypothetical protein [Streptomyces coffeae]